MGVSMTRSGPNLAKRPFDRSEGAPRPYPTRTSSPKMIHPVVPGHLFVQRLINCFHKGQFTHFFLLKKHFWDADERRFTGSKEKRAFNCILMHFDFFCVNLRNLRPIQFINPHRHPAACPREGEAGSPRRTDGLARSPPPRSGRLPSPWRHRAVLFSAELPSNLLRGHFFFQDSTSSAER